MVTMMMVLNEKNSSRVLGMKTNKIFVKKCALIKNRRMYMCLNAIKVTVIYDEPLMDDPCFRLCEA
jgi:hypothetical protein